METKLSMLQRIILLCDDRLLVNDRPRIHEDDLEIEEDEEHRDQVELHAEARLRFALRHHAAFVGGVFYAISPAGSAQQHADEQSGDGESDRHQNVEENRKIFAEHSDGECGSRRAPFTWPLH